jgi:hypothetical protein
MVYIAEKIEKSSKLIPMASSSKRGSVTTFGSLETNGGKTLILKEQMKINESLTDDMYGPNSMLSAVARLVFSTDKVCSIDNITQDERFCKKRSDADKDIRSVICLPVMNDQKTKTYGVMLVCNKLGSSNKFRFQDLLTISSLAHLGAVAIENCILFQKSQDISSSFSSLAGEVKLHLIAYNAAKIAASVMQAESSLLYLCDHTKGEVYTFIGGDLSKKVTYKLSSNENSVCNKVAKTGKPFLAAMLQQSNGQLTPGIDFSSAQSKVQNLICIPLFKPHDHSKEDPSSNRGMCISFPQLTAKSPHQQHPERTSPDVCAYFLKQNTWPLTLPLPPLAVLKPRRTRI